MTMQFRKTKTDQLAFGENKTLKATGEKHLCPVEALARMQRAWPTRFAKEHAWGWAEASLSMGKWKCVEEGGGSVTPSTGGWWRWAAP